ncbi:MAG: hypothetical protein ACO3FI_02365 [Cyclobacteriaceae bacterium]
MSSRDQTALLSLPVISVSAEIFKSFFEFSKVMALRNNLCMAIVLLLIIRYFHEFVRFNTTLILLAGYLLLCLVMQGADFEAYQSWIMAFESKLMLPLAFVLLSKPADLKRLTQTLLITGMLFTVAISLFLILGIGENQYGGTDGFTAGAFKFSRIYTGSFFLISLPMIGFWHRKKNIKNILPFIGLVTALILILSTRRTAIALFLSGGVVFLFWFIEKLPKVILWISVAALLLIALFPLYSGILMKQLEKRQHVFVEQKGFDMESETRYDETLAAWTERFESNNLIIALFGNHLFNSQGNYDEGIHKDRPLHLDINIILHGAGIFGLILFILFYIELILTFFKYRTKPISVKEKVTEATFVSVLVCMIMLIFSGGLTAVTHNMMASLIAGASLRQIVMTSNTYQPLPPQKNFLFNAEKSVSKNWLY